MKPTSITRYRETGSPRRSAAARRARGVILLVMLGLLAMFTLIAVTFVVASGQFRRGAAAASKAEQTGDPFESLLHQALMQVARGSNHPQSVIGPHGLLEDMYGNGDAVTGCAFIENTVQGANPPTTIYNNGAQMTTRSARTQPYKGATTAPFTGAPMLIEIGAYGFGWDREPGVALVDDDNNTIVDDIAEVPNLGSAAPPGDDCFLGSTRAHPAMLGIAPTAWQAAWASKVDPTTNAPLPFIDNVDNYYAGRVITFVNGDCAGQSSYIVRSKLLPVTPVQPTTDHRTILYIQPFANGSQPSHKDRFVINGRAFNGAGFGYNPYDPTNNAAVRKPVTLSGGQLNQSLRALDMPYRAPFITPPSFDGTPYGHDPIRDVVDPTTGIVGEMIAHCPNPTDSGYRDYLNRYGPIVDADEDYDAPDEQNMLLSYTVWVPSLDGGTPGRFRTIFPSLHRPDLVKYMTMKYATNVPTQVPVARWEHVAPHIRRRYIFRPDPSDHYDWTQEPNAIQPQGTDGWTPGEPFLDVNSNGQWDVQTVDDVGKAGGPEPFIDLPPMDGAYYIGDRTYYNTGFDAMDGPWDVDNDGDDLPDSIWVDLGAPVTTAQDGRFVKPLFAILVRDLDGRINVNAHGSHKHYTRAPAAYGGYTGNKPPGMQTQERTRIGAFDWAAYQFEPDVAWNTIDVMRVHWGGDPEDKRDSFAMHEVPFQGLWALPYYRDMPAAASLYPRSALSPTPTFPAQSPNRGGPRPLMFDRQGAVTNTGAYDPVRAIRGFEPAVGQGWSVADINLAPVLINSIHGYARLPSSNTSGAFTPSSIYRSLLEGKGHATGAAPPQVGRYGEGHLLPPNGVGGAFPGLTGPRAGVTDPIVSCNPATMTPMLHLLATGASLPDASIIPPYRGDDDVPGEAARFYLGSNDMRFIRGSALRNSFMPVSMAPAGYGVSHPSYSPSPQGSIIGDFGTPGDADSDGFVALDATGQPVFHNMGTANEEFDAPTEINLHKRYFAQTYFGPGGLARTPQGTPITADEDAPFTPAELERMLRYNDSGTDVLPNRLLVHFDESGRGGMENEARHSMTTESWDLPCPHVAPTPELALGLRALNLPLNNPSLGDLLRAKFYISTGANVNSVADAATQELTARLATVAMRSYKWLTIPADITTATGSGAAAADVPHQWPRVGTPTVAGFRLTFNASKRRQTRLLSPDLGLGVRMDVNAPFGNGYDDNFNSATPYGMLGNGVVDEPYEWVYAPGGLYEPITGGARMSFDGNRDGNWDSRIDEEARQQYAKELYCLMMLLIDQNYVMPLPASVSPASYNATSSATGGEESQLMTTAASQLSIRSGAIPIFSHYHPAGSGLSATDTNVRRKKMQRWLVARRIAQWAINAADFRDRDAIMTPFEFDADPFADNDGDAANAALIQPHTHNSNGTWDVDGYLIDDPLRPSSEPQDRTFPWRGVVWGCEYPDLVLTETAAFHDRRTQNLAAVTGNNLTFDNPVGQTNRLSTTDFNRAGPTPPTNTETDPHWDQRRMPQGTALFELYCTGNPNNPALPRELYGFDGTNLYLDLARTAYTHTTNTAARVYYPVWRLCISESHYAGMSSLLPVTDTQDMHLSVADRLRAFPGTCSLELRDPGMSLLPQAHFENIPAETMKIERVVVFGNPSYLHTTPAIDTNYIKNFPITATTTTDTAATAGLPQLDDTWKGQRIEVFYNVTRPHGAGSGTANPANVIREPRPIPGDYVVVGPARTGATTATTREALSEGPHITNIGQTQRNMVTSNAAPATTLTTMAYTQPNAVVSLGNWTDGTTFEHDRLKFLVTSVNGHDEYPIRITGTDNNYTGGHPLNGLVRPMSASTVNPPIYGDVASTMPTFRQIRPPVSVACGTFIGSSRLVGMNISEPHSQSAYYYPAPDADTTDPWRTSPVLRWRDQYSTVYDIPFDHFDTNGAGTETRRNENIPSDAGVESDGTLLNYKTVFLQRLADPTRGWHRECNPYLTVDWMPIDLTIFNGESHYTYGSGTPATRDLNHKSQLEEVADATISNPPRKVRIPRMPNRPANPSAIPANAYRFGSRQKGSPRTPFRCNYSYMDLWSQPDWLDTSAEFDTRPPLTDTVAAQAWVTGSTGSRVKQTWNTATAPFTAAYYNCAPVRWQDPFDHTFGYLNLGYHMMRSPDNVRASLPRQIPEWIATGDNRESTVLRRHARVSPVREPLRRPRGDAQQFAGWLTEADLVSTTDYGDDHSMVRYIGTPRRPFNWLTWNNRPYAGSMELMIVPASSPGRLLYEYSMRQTVPPSMPDLPANNVLHVERYAPFSGRRSGNHYMPPIPAAAGSVSSGHANPQASIFAGQFESGYLVKPPYGHLLNFFESNNAHGARVGPAAFHPPTGTSSLAAEFPAAPNHYRFFEFVSVPSRFSGTRQAHFVRGSYNEGVIPGGAAIGTQWEHPGFPFTAPFNTIPTYREPGRVNINTIMMMQPRTYSRTESNGNLNYLNRTNTNERMRDDGAAIWRAVLNEFHPSIRWISGTADIVDGRTSRGGFDHVNTAGTQHVPPFFPSTATFLGSNMGQTAKSHTFQRMFKSSTWSGKHDMRAGVRAFPDGTMNPTDGMKAAADVTVNPHFFNPSDDTCGNFHQAFASMFLDDPRSDPRGPNAVMEDWQYWNRSGSVRYSDDRLMMPFWNGGSPAGTSRHEGWNADHSAQNMMRPSMFMNPFRSFLSDFSNVSYNLKRFSSAVDQSTNLQRPLLAVDATLMRRTDTTWNPWSTDWLPFPANTSNVTGLAPTAAGNNPSNALYSPAQIDPRFDPLFVLNYPRPWRQRTQSSNLFDVSYLPGNVSQKPAWWQFSGYTSSLFHYVSNAAPPANMQASAYGSINVEHVRVKDSDFRNTDRNPFFRYQMYTKLSNSITTRSNVYAIWVTVGYFECERVSPTVFYPVQTGHPSSEEFRNKHRFPDGFRILRELGSDNGEAVRHRAFAILDRTIPVGFLRGENLNVDRCFLIRRIVD